MHLFDVHPKDRAAFEETIATTQPEHLELALLQCAQQPDDPGYDPSGSAWLAKHMPTLARWAD
ncbi:MAG: hypothetical protein AAF968_03840 [Pseudomonadota bacterium]